MLIRKSALLLAVLSLLASIFGCTGATTAEVPATLELMQEIVTLAPGASSQLTWTLSPDPDGTVLFTTSDATVAVVSAEGVVTAVAPGTATISGTYGDSVVDTVTITVIASYVITAPRKSIYLLGEDLSLRGGSIAVFDADGALLESVALSTDMILSWEPDVSGTQVVTFAYAGLTLGFTVTVLSGKQEQCRFDDFILIDMEPKTGDKIEFALTKGDVEGLLAAVDNVYDYAEIDILAYFTSPSGDVKVVSAFWYQDYDETFLSTTVDTRHNLEGNVTLLPDDYAIVLGYVADGNPQYRIRYETEESGSFEAAIYVRVDGDVIQTFDKQFDVANNDDAYERGYVSVDAANGRHFVFSEGGSYIPVGQNVAWYTSSDRGYYDYKAWFEKMGGVGMNYARVWMAAWGFSIFWDDVYDYDARQENMMNLDATLDLADDNGIYIQLCLLHHGMFSETVNPMWPGASNTWYLDKYGGNSYADIISSPGQFFTSDVAKAAFKNQLQYIVARWGYSDNILSWELFNEVDWVEEYTATAGNAWHREMAEYLKDIDPYGHMVTTSFKGDSFLSSTYQAFGIDAIDYVCVHRYGIYDHVDTLPLQQKNGYLVFGKPILYAEVGYSGAGGAAQLAVDPENITLHQELWGGMMGGGAGTGMNWWWESWIHPADAYGEFAGAAAFGAAMDLSGSGYARLQEVSGVDLNQTYCAVIGYLLDDRTYAYIYDKGFDLDHTDLSVKEGTILTVPGRMEGVYDVRTYDTITGELVSAGTVAVGSDGILRLSIPDFSADIAVSAVLREGN
jgi:hypothetical protein